MNLLNFENYCEKYLHKNYSHTEKVVDLLKNEEISDLFFKNEFEKNDFKKLNSFFFKNKLNNIVLYHGTSSKHDILEQGILRTTSKTKKSFQSEEGFVYLSVFSDSAETFAKIAYPYDNVNVYKIVIPIEHLKADEDQLRNMRLYSGINVFDDLAHSALLGHGFRVKGDIPPYMITQFK